MLLNRLKPISVVVLSTLLSSACGAVDEVIEPVIGELLRSESTLWDVLNGELVAQDPACDESGD